MERIAEYPGDDYASFDAARSGAIESESRLPGAPSLPPLSDEALKFADQCLASLPDDSTLTVKCIRKLMATAYDCGHDLGRNQAELDGLRARGWL